LNTLIVDLAAFSGMEMENMTRGLGWRFLDFGRRLERSVHISDLLRSAVTISNESLPGSRQTQSSEVLPSKTSAILEPVLEIADSVMTYRRRYLTSAQLSSVLELLLLDEGNPRALTFQLAAMIEHLSQMPEDPNGIGCAVKKDRAMLLQQRLHRTRTWELAQAWEHGSGQPLEKLLTEFIIELGLISNDLSHLYFSHTVPRIS
jgi:uncharacterized alpha-E superfamily protein